MYAQPDDHELDYLRDLLCEFQADPELDAEAALKLVFDRYQVLERNFSKLGEEISVKLEGSSRVWPFYKQLCTQIHKYLYNNILSNAGHYRSSSDKYHGIVEFGGLTSSGHRGKFRGVAPRMIENELIACFEILDNPEPIKSSILFYQEFSFIHPFYDANGRIGRLIVSIYLYSFGYLVSWGQIDSSHGKFMKKLNECHKRRNQPAQFDKYFGYLVNYWEKYIVPYSEFLGRNDPFE